VAGARAVCRARRRTRERGEGEKRPLLFIAQKVKKGDFTVIHWSSTALFDVRSTGQGADLSVACAYNILRREYFIGILPV